MSIAGVLTLLAIVFSGLHWQQQRSAPGKLFAFSLTKNQAQEVSTTLSSWSIPHALSLEGDNILVSPEMQAGLVYRLSQKGVPHRDNTPKEPPMTENSLDAQ